MSGSNFGGLMPLGLERIAKATKKGAEYLESLEANEYNAAYFKGLKGLSSEAREAWEKQYLNEISGLVDTDKDEVFRNSIFKDLYKDSDDPTDQEIWNNRNQMSLQDRDIYVAKKAVEKDLDGKSGLEESNINLLDAFVDPGKISTQLFAKRGETLRGEAQNFLGAASEDLADIYRKQVASMDTPSKDALAENFDEMSRTAFPLYKEYIGTDKLDLSNDELAELAASYTAWENVGGTNFAYRMLNDAYQNLVAEKQSIWEKTVNTGAQFVDSGAGMIIRAAGMLGAMTTIGLEEDEGYWDNVLDNAVTRYGDRVATTQSWNTARQEYLEETGLQDNPILNSAAQQHSILTWNTPFEVLGQYGFTAASTILSFGGSAVVNGAVKGAGVIAKMSSGAKGLNTTAKGIRIAKNLIRAKDIGNVLVAGGIGGVEGGMNAVATRDKTLKDLNADIDNRLNQAVDTAIDNYAITNRAQALDLLAKSGHQIPADIELTDSNIAELLKNDQGVREMVTSSLSSQFDEERAMAEKNARDAMMSDFVGNSFINGFVNTTLQASLNAPSIQRSLRKFGLQKSPFDDLGVGISGSAQQGWRATAKKFTRGQAVKNRLKEAWGEGIEEYTQDLSGAFGEGFAKDRMSQYIDFKYGNTDGTDAFEQDTYRNFMTGLHYMGEAALSKQSIKDGLYGILSTAVGGPNINVNNRGQAGKKDGEGNFSYFARRSPITWRSAFGPIFNNEVGEVNASRDKLAENINDFFADPEKQNLFFDLEASTNWMTQVKRATLAGDEKAVRDAKLGQAVSTIYTVNELRGSAYYDAIMESIKARAAFNPENLNDPNSVESEAARQYIAYTENRGETITSQQAIQAIKQSASDLLSLMDQAEEEAGAVEKLFGSEMDKDTKESLIYHRIATADSKKRIDQLDNELQQVTTALNQESAEPSGLSARSRRIISRFGSLAEAEKSIDKMIAEKKSLDADIEELASEIKSDKVAMRLESATREDRAAARAAIAEKQEVVDFFRQQSKEMEKTIADARRDVKRYKREATSTDEEGTTVENKVLTASEIMAMAPTDRAYILDPKNRSKYSAAQHAEIEKVEVAGTSLFSDFNSKIADRGKLESSYNGMLRVMLKMTQEPETFAKYQATVKQAKQRELLNKKYSDLAEYDGNRSYADFAEEMHRIFTEESPEDIKAAIRVLTASGSAYYDTYKNANEFLNNVYSRVNKSGKFKSLSQNDQNLFANTLEYLVSKGVDIEDPNAIVSALSSKIIEGDEGSTIYNEFADFIQNNNAKNGEQGQTAIPEDLTGTAIQLFKDIMASLREDATEQIANNRTVEPTETREKQSAPVQAPQPKDEGKPGIFGEGAYSSPDEGFTQEQQEDKEESVVGIFRKNSGDNVAKAAEVAINTGRNTPSHVGDETAIKSAEDKINDMKENFFESPQDFADAILKEANELDITGEADKQAVAGILRRAAAAASNQAKMSKGTQTDQTPLTGIAGTRYQQTTQQGRTMGTSSNSAIISTFDIPWLKKHYPTGALTKYLAKYKVEEFLSNPESITGGETVVKFIVDSQFATDVEASMQEANMLYTVNDLPIVPVVEVKQKNDQVITIVEDGKEHYYQPIGVLPATGNPISSGANRLGILREIANGQTQNQIIKDHQGNEITSKIVGNVTATPPRHLQQNQSVIRIGIASLTDEEKSQLNGKTAEEARKTPVYEKLRSQFLRHLEVVQGKFGPELAYRVSNLKKGETVPFLITRTAVSKTKSRNSDTLVVDLFRDNKVEEALQANSRVRRFASELQKFFADNKLDGSLFVPDGKDGYTLSQEGTRGLRDLAEKLGGVLGNFIVLPSKAVGGAMSYEVVPTYTTDPATDSDMFELRVSNGQQSITLTTFTGSGVTQQNAFEALKNLMLNEDGTIREAVEGQDFIKWQIPYSDVQQMHSNVRAMENIQDLYDDRIFEGSVESFDYTVKSVNFQAPFTTQGTPAYPVKTVVNDDNAASTGTDKTITETPSGETVDSTSGIVIEQQKTEAKRDESPVRKAVKAIIESSTHINLSEDESVYVDDRTGKVYARATSIIAADQEGERFNSESPWGLPSTRIGNSIDMLVRDFFDSTLQEHYPNMTDAAKDKFIESLKTLQNQLTASGLTIVPKGVKVAGELNATDSTGAVHSISVAGTLDLLAYDKDGNFYIFDMKTFRTGIDEKKKAKYARQLSLYKKFLEDNYGVKVKSLSVIPIKVDYPSPERVTYGVKEGTNDQLTSNRMDYTGANPVLKTLLPIKEMEVNLVFEKMTDAEREMFKDAVEAQGGATPTEITKVAPVDNPATPIDPHTGMPLSGYENPLLKGKKATTKQAGKSFVVSDLRWGVWEGLTEDQKKELPKLLEDMGITQELWESNDSMIMMSDTEKEQIIKCYLGI